MSPEGSFTVILVGLFRGGTLRRGQLMGQIIGPTTGSWGPNWYAWSPSSLCPRFPSLSASTSAGLGGLPDCIIHILTTLSSEPLVTMPYLDGDSSCLLVTWHDEPSMLYFIVQLGSCHVTWWKHPAYGKLEL